MLELPELPPSVRLLTNPEINRLYRLHGDLPESPDDCPTCKGKGSFRWWTDDRLGIAEWKCRCEDQFRLHRFFLHANVLLGYQRLGWGDARQVCEDARRVGSLDPVNDYLAHFDAYSAAGCGMIFHGTVGNGKTLIASLVFKELLERGFDGYCVTFSEMIDWYTKGWKDPEEKDWFHLRIKNAPVLFIDDIGREYDGGRGLPVSTFDEVLRHRVASCKTTILTTNLAPEDLRLRYGLNVMSLLCERSVMCEFVGEDFRERARLRLLDEVRQGLTRPIVFR